MPNGNVSSVLVTEKCVLDTQAPYVSLLSQGQQQNH